LQSNIKIKMKNYSIPLISLYKLLGAIIRVCIGILILYFSGDIKEIIGFIFKREILEDQTDFIFSYLLNHIAQPSAYLAYVLAFSLIIFSLLEIVFAIGLLLRKEWGAVGLFIISVLWIPIEILFISKFLLTPKTISLVLDVIILVLLFKMITHSRRYFKN
jgi:uncharacterized membrane protein